MITKCVQTMDSPKQHIGKTNETHYLVVNFLTPANLDRNLKYLQTYTSKVGKAFGGCCSTTAHQELLKQKIPCYFSACLTLTYNMQWTSLDHDNVCDVAQHELYANYQTIQQ